MTARILTEDILRRDNSTTKIAQGMGQLVSTAKAVRAGTLDAVIGDRTKPFVGAVVTYGAIPFANIPWYRSQIVMPRLEGPGDVWPLPLGGWPQILHVSALESLVELLQATGKNMMELVAEKEQQHYMEAGDWDTYLRQRMKDEEVTGTGEYEDDRTHNDVNELTARDTDDDGTDDITLVYDAVGNLTDDGENYEYVWDPFGRLRKVQTRDAIPKLVAEYRFNGLGHRIGWHYDVTGDGKTGSGDPKYNFVYDERWRIVATYRDDDGDPKEQFVHHNAGPDGLGGSSYIDTVILRDKDADTAWGTTSDGALEERVYHCQNWRADVVALVDDAGELVEQVRYSAYGIPFGMFSGDVDSDGDVDGNDVTQVNTWTSGYDVRGDLDLDDDVDSRDETIATNNQSKDLGWGLLSYVSGRSSLAGYLFDPTFAAVTRVMHVRHRVLSADLGRWTRRDPLGYVDGHSLYAYVGSRPHRATDPSGAAAAPQPLDCTALPWDQMWDDPDLALCPICPEPIDTTWDWLESQLDAAPCDVNIGCVDECPSGVTAFTCAGCIGICPEGIITCTQFNNSLGHGYVNALSLCGDRCLCDGADPCTEPADCECHLCVEFRACWIWNCRSHGNDWNQRATCAINCARQRVLTSAPHCVTPIDGINNGWQAVANQCIQKLNNCDSPFPPGTWPYEGTEGLSR